MDANILLSIVNLKLRDKYENLDEFFDNEDYDKEEVINTLKSLGYEYDSTTNQFKSKQ